MARFFGTPDGVAVGQFFIDRKDLHEQSVHRPLQAGISGTRAEGADSIVVSGGYVDDEDHGDYIIYTGHGGRTPGAKAQTQDQSRNASGNAGLITSQVLGLPVRVTRGVHRLSPYAPPAGYQYAGLYLVTDSWMERGKEGFDIVRFRLDRIPEQASLWTKTAPDLDPAYAASIVTRRIRDTAISREVKAVYSNRCQVCSTAIPGIGDRHYSEGAHVKPLGRPHLGADSLDNLLCLCPNHHTQLDIGGMVIRDDFSVMSTSNMRPFANLTFAGGHQIQVSNARYHREHWLTDSR